MNHSSTGSPTDDDAAPVAPEDQAASLQATRAQILRRFESWLDDVLTDEPAPDSIDAQVLDELRRNGDEPADDGRPDRRCDLFALWTAMTTLTQELKLQSRTFKQFQESLSPMEQWQRTLDALARAQSQAGDRVDHLGQAQSQTTDQVDQLDRTLKLFIEQDRTPTDAAAPDSELLDVLLDLHARFDRGLTLSRQAVRHLDQSETDARPTFWQRCFGRRTRHRPAPRAKEAVQALQEGYALPLDRLGDALRRHEIAPVDCLGKPLDPHTMAAVNVVPGNGHPEGTVLEVYEPGFSRGGEVIRLAKVKVAGRVDHDEARSMTDE